MKKNVEFNLGTMGNILGQYVIFNLMQNKIYLNLDYFIIMHFLIFWLIFKLKSAVSKWRSFILKMPCSWILGFPEEFTWNLIEVKCMGIFNIFSFIFFSSQNYLPSSNLWRALGVHWNCIFGKFTYPQKKSTHLYS